ncbi:MAG: extracellular solute-binding protein [Isosphaeraceae bacterium]
MALAASLGLTGCSEPDGSPGAGPVKPSFPGVRITMTAMGDSAILAGLSSQCGEWRASRGGEIVLKDQPIRSANELSDADLVIFPGQQLGNLVDADLLETVANKSVLPSRPSDNQSSGPDRNEAAREPQDDPFQYTDILPAFRDQVTRYGTDRLALPLGGSALVLVYRRDAFSRQANIDAARLTGIKLEPPTTWTQLDALAKFFQGRDWNGDGAPEHGIAAVLGQDPEDLGNATFLARAASLGQHRDQYSFLFDADSMTPRIDAPPFVEALRGILAWKDYGPKGMESLTASAAREAFRSGKVALLIDRAERAALWSGGHPVGVAPLPGSERVYEPLRKNWETPSSPNTPSYLPAGGGWMVGIRRGLSGAQHDAALDLAKYLTSPEIVSRVAAERGFFMLPVRGHQMSQGFADPTSAPDVDSRQWAEAVSRTLMGERVVPGLRIPDADSYLEELARGRISALKGKAPEAALHQVAALWTARTNSRGKARQLWHYRRSLNSLATLPQPPERGQMIRNVERTQR